MDSRFEGGRRRRADRTGTMPVLVVNTVTMACNGLCQCCVLLAWMSHWLLTDQRYIERKWSFE